MSPQAVYKAESPFGVFLLEIAAVVLMLHIQGTIMVMIGVFNLDHRYRAQADILQEGGFDFPPAVVIRDFGDDRFVTTRLVLKQIHLAHYLRGKKATEKRDVTIDLAGGENC